MEKSSLKKSSKRKNDAVPAEIFQIVGENDNEDNLDLNFLETVDFQDIDDYDPSVQDGFKTAFQQQIYTLVQLDPGSTESHERQQTFEVLNFKIMVSGYESSPLSMRLEITSEEDVQFYYQTNIQREEFSRIMTDNELAISYEQFIPMLKKLLEDCVEKPQTCQAIFTLDDDQGNAYFKFNHTSEYRVVSILQLEFKQLEDEQISSLVSYRINSTENKAMLVAERLKDIMDILMDNNPALIEQLQKAA